MWDESEGREGGADVCVCVCVCVAVLLLIMQGIQRRLAECGHLWAYTDEMYTDSTEFYRYHPRYITPNRFRNLQKGLALTIRLLT